MKARRIKKAFIQDRLSRRMLSMLDDESTQDEILSDVQNPVGVLKQNVS